MKHLILTRFYCFKMHLDIFDEKILSRGLELMKKYLIPSLENQTNKDFTHIVIINDNHKEMESRSIAELLTMKPDYDFMVFTKSEFDTFRRGIIDKEVIISRIDSDDCAFREAVADTQRNFDSSVKIKFYGYRNGITMEEGKPSEIRLENRLYPGGGTNSQFQSLMFNDFPNYSGSVHYDHSNVYEFLRSKDVVVNSDTYVVNESVEYAYIWMQHNQNDHTVVKGGTKYGNLISLSKERLKYLFGIEV